MAGVYVAMQRKALESVHKIANTLSTIEYLPIPASIVARVCALWIKRTHNRHVHV